MPANEFIEVKEKGMFTGFSNMFDKENARWWKTEKWYLLLFAWIVLLDMFIAFLLYVIPYTSGTASKVEMAAGVFPGLMGVYLPFGILIMTHDTIIKELESGTMAWIMSKPVSRMSFALSKILANFIGVTVLMVIVPGIIGYGIISLYGGSFINIVNFSGALGVIALLGLFYISLVFMLGIVTRSRYVVLGVTTLYIMTGLMASSQLPGIAPYLTWDLSKMAGDFAAYGILQSNYPAQFASTLIWIIGFLVISFIGIEKIEL